jgi:glycosyl transferase, family 25
MLNFFLQFERIYIINLAARTDRKREISDQLRSVGLRLNSLPVQLFPAVEPVDAAEFPNIGSRGCFLSHLGILQQAHSDGLRSVLILEDDLNFVENFSDRAISIAHEWSELSPSFTFFYGGGEVALPFSPQGHSELMPVSPHTPVGLTHFLGIRGASCISDLVTYLEAMIARSAGDPEGGPMHVDGAYSWFRRAHPNYETAIAHPEIGYQRASRTAIHPLRWFDRLMGLRSLVNVIRRMRNG